MKLASLALPLLVTLACSRRSSPPDVVAAGRDAAPESVADAADAAVDAAPEPLGGYPWQFELTEPSEKDGGKPARLGFVSVPLGAREPRPIMVALHGGGDRPEWACGEWRAVASAYPFLVCPRGPGGSDSGLGWSSVADTKVRITRAIAATKQIFGTWVRDAPIVLVGFSMGATQTALLAQREPATYPRIGISESAYAPEPALALAAPWSAGGGKRVVFFCTTIGCEPTFRNAARNVARHHAAARLNIAGTNQHGIWDVVVQSMRRDFPWLVENAEGWESYRAPPEQSVLPGKTEVFEAN